MRGKVYQSQGASSSGRITPAHAGKSKKREKTGKGKWDHPRTCGEKIFFIWRKDIVLGSPPHMRGKVFIVRIFTFRVRITPAHAGKSYPLKNLFKLVFGSPPHMRGKALERLMNDL